MTDPRFDELIIEGKPNLIRGFVHGVLLAGEGRGAQALFFNRDEHIKEEGFGQHLAEWLGLRERLVHLVIDAPSAEQVEAALGKEHGLALRLRERRTITGASFSFEYKVYAPIYARKVREILESHSPAVALEGFAPREETHPSAEGTELYAPEHHFSEEARGVARGPLEELVALHRACRTEQLIHWTPIDLEFEAGSAAGR